MKVGTDGVLLGAWSVVRPSDRCALDIGAGTGLISLMLAQRGELMPLHVDAVEIDQAAYLDIEDNIAAFPLPDRITAINDSLQNFSAETINRYDVIVCNPPFFVDSLHTPDASRTVARHAVSLNYSELLGLSVKLLSPDGRLSVIIPYQQCDGFIETASGFGLSAIRLTHVYPKLGVPPKRSLIELCRHYEGHCPPLPDSITIELSDRHDYSPEYISLTSDFYLNF